MKYIYMHIFLLPMLVTQAVAAEQPDVASMPDKLDKPAVEVFCEKAAHNVLVGYSQAKKGEEMIKLMSAFPEHKQEILAGYKLFELGKKEYEAYAIFKEYCYNLFNQA